MNKRVLDNEHIHIEYIDGIMIGYFKEGLNITLNVAKEIVKVRTEFFENKYYPMLIEDKGVVSMTKEARDFFSTKEGANCVTAGALLLKSVFSTYLGNFFLKVAKPITPAKIFTDKNKAIEWLQKFK